MFGVFLEIGEQKKKKVFQNINLRKFYYKNMVASQLDHSPKLVTAIFTLKLYENSTYKILAFHSKNSFCLYIEN